MKISFLLELLLVLVIVAYAAQARIINGKDPKKTNRKQVAPLRQATSQSGSTEDIDALVQVEPDLFDDATGEDQSTASSDVSLEVTTIENTDDQSPINKYCKCTSYECNCCREFRIPIAGVGSNGCATVNYLDGERMSVALKFGDRLVASRVVSSRRPTPICLPLPGGFSRFCGRIYGISRRQDDFQACLGLELRADDEVEAALRVSCFKFGPRGLEMTEAQPMPPNAIETDDDDDDDDDDLFGGLLEDDDDSDEDADEPDYTGFSLLDTAGDTVFADRPTAKKPSRDVLSLNKSENATVSNLNGTKAENGTKKKDEDDDDDDDDDDEDDVFDIVQTIVGSQAADDDDDDDGDIDDIDDNEIEDDEAESDEDEDEDEKDTEKTTIKGDSEKKKQDPAKKKKEPESTSIFSRLYRFLSARKS